MLLPEEIEGVVGHILNSLNNVNMGNNVRHQNSLSLHSLLTATCVFARSYDVPLDFVFDRMREAYGEIPNKETACELYLSAVDLVQSMTLMKGE